MKRSNDDLASMLSLFCVLMKIFEPRIDQTDAQMVVHLMIYRHDSINNGFRLQSNMSAKPPVIIDNGTGCVIYSFLFFSFCILLMAKKEEQNGFKLN